MQDMQSNWNQDSRDLEEKIDHQSHSLVVSEGDEPTPGSILLPAVVSLEADLFFAMRLDDVISAKGGRSIIVDSPDEFVTAVDRHFPVLALVDLKSAGDWNRAIRRCKLRPHTRQIPIYAFGSHVEVETLKAARQAGADHAWARSKMMEELVSVVERHIHLRLYSMLDGWDGELSCPGACRHRRIQQGQLSTNSMNFSKRLGWKRDGPFAKCIRVSFKWVWPFTRSKKTTGPVH